MTPEDINKTAWEVWAKARKEVMCADQVAILAAALVEEREKAVAEIRTPSEGMLAATRDIVVGFSGEYGDYNVYCDDYVAEQIYEAMISVAIRSTDKAEKP